MFGVFAGAMTTVMALCIFCGVVLLGGVNPVLAVPAYGAVLLVVLVWSGSILYQKEVFRGISVHHIPVAVFLAYCLVRYVQSPFEWDARIEMSQIVICALVLLVTSTYRWSRSQRTIFLAALMILAALESGYGIWQALSESGVVLAWVQHEAYIGRASGSYICPNHFAGFLELVLGLVVARAVFLRGETKSVERSVLIKILTIYVGLMVIGGIAFSRSRAGWVSTACGMVFLAMQVKWQPRSIVKRMAVAGIVMGGMLLIIWNVTTIRNYFLISIAPSKAGVALADPTMGGRSLMWTGTTGIIRDHPVWGTGLASWQWFFPKYQDPQLHGHPDYAHNDILNLASDYGIVGLGLAAWVLAAFFRCAWRIAQSKPGSEQSAFAIGAMSSVVSILVHSWFDFNLHIPANSILLSAIMGFTLSMREETRFAVIRPNSILGRFLLVLGMFAFCAVAVWRYAPAIQAWRYAGLASDSKKDLDYANALKFAEMAISKDPKFVIPHIVTGDIYRSMAGWRKGPGKRAERLEYALKAVASYERALKLNPNHHFCWLSKGKAYLLAEQGDLALEGVQRAIQLAPTHADSHYTLGTIYRDRGEDKLAYESFSRAAALEDAEIILQWNTYDAKQELRVPSQP